jgi:hypothetical protein
MAAKSQPASLPPSDFVREVLNRMAAEALAKANPFDIPPTPAERGADVLSDTIPPVEPPPVARTCDPIAHDVVAWRYDGTVRKTNYATLEAAREVFDALHYAVVYKAMIMRGREMIARRLIEAPL